MAMASIGKRQAFNGDTNSNNDGYSYGYGDRSSKENWWWTPVSLTT
jgi:hypothetical protein